MNQMHNNNQMNFFPMSMNNQFNNPMMNNPMMNNPMMNMPMMNSPMMNNPMMNMPMMNNPMMNMPMLNNPMMNNMMEMNMQMMPGIQMMINEVNPIIPRTKQKIESNNKKNEEIKIPRKKYNAKREIPPILLKNANRKIETITFQVEKDLKLTKSLFQTQNIDEIFKRLFQKRKKDLNEKGVLVYINENEPLDVLHYKFDTHESQISNYGKKSLMQGLVFAYKNHYPINVSPDMIWLLILQGYSRFMDKYSELVREKYVNFEGQKTLYINRYGKPINAFSKEDWNGVIDECVEQISDHIGKEIVSNLQSDFSTTNAATLLASQASIMSAMKHYFKYEMLGGGCGVSYITLEGSVEDWEKIKSKLNYLSNFALKWWTKHLIPIIDNIIKTKKYYNKNKKINNELVDFWKTMIRIKGKGDLYDPHILNGWIIKFIPNLDGEHPKIYEEINENWIPDQIISCPLNILEDNSNGFKVVYKCDIASGFFGMIQDKRTLTVKPVIGYAIVVEEKETSKMTREDKEEIIKNYFN